LLVLGNKKDEPVSFRQALVWSMLWVALALVFNMEHLRLATWTGKAAQSN